MRIGKGSIAGFGIAAALALITAVPAHADTNDGLAAAPNKTTVVNVNPTALNFNITNIGAWDAAFTWNPNAMQVNGDTKTWCEISLLNKNPMIPGTADGYATQDWSTGALTFGNVTLPNGKSTHTVRPGSTYQVQLLCHDSNDRVNYQFKSAYFTAKDVVTETPEKPVTKLYDDGSILTLLNGAWPEGNAWATGCVFRLYKDDTLVKTLTQACDGVGSYTFENLTAGIYRTQVAAKNAAGLSDWSPKSDAVIVKQGASADSVTIKPGKVGLDLRVDGKHLRVQWTKAATNGAGAIKRYNITLTGGGKTVYRHSANGAGHVNTTLAHGTYQLTIKVTNAQGQSSLTTTTVKM